MKIQAKKQILTAAERLGLRALTCLLSGLFRVLHPSETWWGLQLCLRRLTQRENLQTKYIKGVDKALKENLTPEEAVDRLARKAGVSKKEIKDSKLRGDSFISEHEFLERNRPTRADLDARQEALEASIADSIK